MSISNISPHNRFILWGKSGGRCQYRGCNKSLFVDALTKGEFNQAYIAHIIADKSKGPRGNEVLSEQLADDISNLMLLCDAHHRLIDKIDVAGHDVNLLRQMKREHEDRIEKVADINSDMQSHVVIYKANVGKHSPVITFESVKEYLLPTHYPALSDAIDLGLTNSPQRDKDDIFWQTEIDNLLSQYKEQLQPKFRKSEIKHLSLFAFAPQPLLIKLGTLINDIHDVEIHQPIRTPKTWRWLENEPDIKYHIQKPKKRSTVVALNISLSADISNDRITQILGNDCSIHTIRIDAPFNDFLRSKKHLQDFSVAIRKLFNHTKAQYDAYTPIHVFPAMPVVTAIELGRSWMPKADMPLIIYDENTANSGFFKALEIVNE